MIPLLVAACKKEDSFTITDWVGYGYYIWQNDSDHLIRAQIASPGIPDPSRMIDFALSPKQTYELTAKGGRLGDSFGFSWTESFLVSFDGDRFKADYRGAFYPDAGPFFQQIGYNIRRDPTRQDNYAAEKVDAPEGCKECPGMRYTYRFTEADYEAAKAMAEAPL